LRYVVIERRESEFGGSVVKHWDWLPDISNRMAVSTIGIAVIFERI
jgi:hypothetical protein